MGRKKRIRATRNWLHQQLDSLENGMVKGHGIEFVVCGRNIRIAMASKKFMVIERFAEIGKGKLLFEGEGEQLVNFILKMKSTEEEVVV